MANRPLTAAEEILLAGAELSPDGGKEFSEWDLTVAAWKRNRNRFGCRGYEDSYPDHKRTMMEIMAASKKDNPLRQGWMEKTRANHYRMTKLGLAQADVLMKLSGQAPAGRRSPQNIYDAVKRYVFHRSFLAHCKDREEPRTWLGVSAFFRITSDDPTALEDRLRSAEGAIEGALRWFDEEKIDVLHRGPSRGEAAIHLADVQKLKDFVVILSDRFKVQIDAIRKRSSKGPVDRMPTRG